MQCGVLSGELLLREGLVLCGGKRLSGQAFEAEAGRSAAKKWKTSVRVVSRKGGKTTGSVALADWLEVGGVDRPQHRQAWSAGIGGVGPSPHGTFPCICRAGIHVCGYAGRPAGLPGILAECAVTACLC